ncbi:GNAT family N-acetyltransferase [Paludisphaera soli]|uniref:GNAT family N-acetyltransferase n=1 Tax=Paludisphaera soli TaxID=2712865 RepID=UPI0013EE2D6B|nr:GNAT family N-acetyltransferase [Paludisphaera soli]
MNLHIRWMIRRDLPAVLAIDAGLREPWTEDEFLRRLRERNCIGLVAERGDEVVGFAIYRLRPGCLQVNRLAVHPEHRRRGVGRKILEKLRGKVDGDRRRFLSMWVRESDADAVRFLAAMGLRARLERDIYSDPDEDAYAFLWGHPEADRVQAGAGAPEVRR